MQDSRIVLRILGPTELECPGTDADASVVRQPKRLAVLVYLTLETVGGYRRRDQIVALFWPEVEQGRARTYLRKTIHALRAALGEDLLEMRGDDELRVSQAALSCDAVMMLQLINEKRWREALELYRGDFLGGLFVDAIAPDLEEWLDAQRRMFRRSAAIAAWEASRAAASAGRLADAVAFAQRGRELDPEDEEGVRHLIDLLDRRGDRGTALKVFSDWQRWLEKEYGVEPAPETRRLANRVKAARKGDSHEAVALTSGARVDALDDVPVPHPTRPAQKRIRTLRAPLVILVAGIAVGSLVGWGASKAAETEVAYPSTVTVQTFHTLGPDTTVAIARVVSATVVSALAADSRILVRDADAVNQSVGVKARGLSRVNETEFILAGTLVSVRDAVRLSLRVLSATSARVVWTGSYHFASDSLTEVVERAVRDLTPALIAKGK